ncbi:EscT/YscT/HrcT family type III secretion system export apparatus protein [Pandoraea terrae]|uniref:EscT/YscT/HrcT family type III secretion system export apparatus protein n=1 Tax=Pandoraea terrae TaxID=1537710 RepID=A0A5E4ZDI5_9BURK|nr:type III secretion system export apparatus subunit SctT [Pandoraea terrae]VVE59144.1 EscT/YscT/HrcT family type III secretion system export apparatus protein [Pandoraea terrae]
MPAATSLAGLLAPEWLPTLAVAMVRPMGLALLLPLLSQGMLGAALLRNAMLLALAMPVLPVVHEALVPMSLTTSAWIALALRELTIGLLLGFVSAIPFWAVDMIGFLVDTMRGASMASVLNPLLGAQSSVFGIAFTQMLCVLFFVTGAAHAVFDAFYQSYRWWPVGAGPGWASTALPMIFGLWQLMQELCVSFALPAVVVMVLVDIALGFVNRSAQQLNVFFLAMPIKSGMVLLMFMVSVPFALPLFVGYFTRMPEWSGYFASMFQ